MRLQKVLFTVAGVRRQGSGVSKSNDLCRCFVGELLLFRLFAGTSNMRDYLSELDIIGKYILTVP